MSVAFAALPIRPLHVAIAAALWLLATGVQAEQPGAAPQYQDHLLIVARTVQPRIAYRGVPLEDNPVRVQATTFPGAVFHNTLDTAMERLVDDGDLGRFGSAGIGSGAAMQGVLTDGRPRFVAPAMLGGLGSAAATPLGAGARAGGAVSAATAGLGTLINGSLLPALGSTAGGGP